MRRRDFLKAVFVVVIGGGFVPEVLADNGIRYSRLTAPRYFDDYLKDYLYKIQNFNRPHLEDIYLDCKQCQVLESCVKRLKRIQRTVGYGNFSLLNFDDALKVARGYSRVGCFTEVELKFLEMIFYEDASLYGFAGEKPLNNITDRIRNDEVVKIPKTGNYLYKGSPVETYEKIKRDIGDQVIMTSGVRSVSKQFLLFLNKAYRYDGNLSLASRSLAPPGYSYHGIGDFDVGQVGFGVANFTDRFTTTEVYRRLSDFGYLNLRYTRDNLLGVRFEPWHIKVNATA